MLRRFRLKPTKAGAEIAGANFFNELREDIVYLRNLMDPKQQEFFSTIEKGDKAYRVKAEKALAKLALMMLKIKNE